MIINLTTLQMLTLVVTQDKNMDRTKKIETLNGIKKTFAEKKHKHDYKSTYLVYKDNDGEYMVESFIGCGASYIEKAIKENSNVAVGNGRDIEVFWNGHKENYTFTYWKNSSLNLYLNDEIYYNRYMNLKDKAKDKLLSLKFKWLDLENTRKLIKLMSAFRWNSYNYTVSREEENKHMMFEDYYIYNDIYSKKQVCKCGAVLEEIEKILEEEIKWITPFYLTRNGEKEYFLRDIVSEDETVVRDYFESKIRPECINGHELDILKSICD